MYQHMILKLEIHLRNVKLIVVDEHNKAFQFNFIKVDSTLRHIGNPDLPMGGYSFVLVGDVGQLSQVKTSPIFKLPLHIRNFLIMIIQEV